MKKQCLVFVLMFSSAAFGLEVFNSQDGRQIVVLQEEDHWSVDTFAISADGWPDKIAHDEYASRELVQKQLDQVPMVPVQVAHLGQETSIKLSKEHFPEPTVELKPRAQVVTEGIWPVMNEWSVEWEAKYSEWVASELNNQFFIKHNIPTSCSDVEYWFRWIFAHDNGLPMANRMSSGAWFTSRSLRDGWRKLPTAPEWYNDKRFLAAMNYLTNNTYTHTLWDDSYTIKIEQGPLALSPGAYHVNKDGGYGHTMLVYKVSGDPNVVPLTTLSSTMPRAVRKLNEFVYSEVKSAKKPLNLFRMRWPDFRNGKVGLIPANEMPGYSPEQDQSDFVKTPRTRYWEEVFYRLNPDLDFGVVVKALRAQIKDAFLRRVSVVEKGLAACKGGGCRNGTAGWEDWSTVSFDERLNINIVVANEFIPKVKDPSALEAELTEPLLTIEGHPLTFGEAMDRWRKYLYSPDPADSVARRWGFDLPPKAEPKTRQASSTPTRRRG